MLATHHLRSKRLYDAASHVFYVVGNKDDVLSAEILEEEASEKSYRAVKVKRLT